MSTKSENLLDIVFEHSARFPHETGEDGIVTVLERQDHPIQRFARKLKVKIPEYRRIDLDEYGSYVYSLLDGQRTVREVGQALDTKFGEQVQPLYERLSLFLTFLEEKNHYIQKVVLRSDTPER